jgi:protein-disulfide isomerase
VNAYSIALQNLVKLTLKKIVNLRGELMTSTTNTSVDLALPVGTRDHIQGLLTAPIVLVEYGDYQCPYCAEAADIVRKLQNRLGDRLCYVYRHFPLTELHPHAVRAAEAAEAAAVGHKFWEMHHQLFQHQSALSETNLWHYAQSSGLNVDKFESDLNKEQHLRHIQEDMRTGAESGVDSTPTFFINGVRHLDDWDADTLLNAMPHRGSADKHS